MSQTVFTSIDNASNRHRIKSNIAMNIEDSKYYIMISDNEDTNVKIIDDIGKRASLRQLEPFKDTIWIEMQEPVYVYKDDGENESVYYNSRLMEEGKLYEIIWEGEKWALKKTDNKVDFQRWED